MNALGPGNLAWIGGTSILIFLGAGRDVSQCGNAFGKETSREWYFKYRDYCLYATSCIDVGVLGRERLTPEQLMPMHVSSSSRESMGLRDSLYIGTTLVGRQKARGQYGYPRRSATKVGGTAGEGCYHATRRWLIRDEDADSLREPREFLRAKFSGGRTLSNDGDTLQARVCEEYFSAVPQELLCGGIQEAAAVKAPLSLQKEGVPEECARSYGQGSRRVGVGGV